MAHGAYFKRMREACTTHSSLPSPQQKPWHPMNFRNRMKTWETEQKHIENAKAKEKAQVGGG